MGITLSVRIAIFAAFVQRCFGISLFHSGPDSEKRKQVPAAPAVCTVHVPATVVAAGDEEQQAQDFLDNAMAPRSFAAGVDKDVRRESDVLGKRRHSLCQEDTYGEILPEGAKVLFSHPAFHLVPDDVFYDLGSGVSRLVAEAGVVGGVQRAVGIELSDNRHELACAGLRNVADAMVSGFPAVTARRQLEARHADMLEADLSDGTALYVNNQCFRDELNAAIVKKLSKQLKQGARIVSVKELPLSADSRLIPNGKVKVAMSWDPKLSLSLYKVR